MKADKHLKKLVYGAVDSSFKNGVPDEKKIRSFVADFKKLPHYKAIFALTEYLKGIKRIIDGQTLIVESATQISKYDKKALEVALSKNFKFQIKNFKFQISNFY